MLRVAPAERKSRSPIASACPCRAFLSLHHPPTISAEEPATELSMATQTVPERPPHVPISHLPASRNTTVPGRCSRHSSSSYTARAFILALCQAEAGAQHLQALHTSVSHLLPRQGALRGRYSNPPTAGARNRATRPTARRGSHPMICSHQHPATVGLAVTIALRHTNQYVCFVPASRERCRQTYWQSRQLGNSFFVHYGRSLSRVIEDMIASAVLW